MTISVGTIAQQALRRLGVRIVPLDDSPTLTEMVPVADIATAALEELGILNADATPPPVGTVPEAEIATSALVELGVLNSVGTPVIGTVPTAEIATGALVELGVLNSDETLAPQTTVLADDIVTAALVELGVLNSDLTLDTDVITAANIATTALIELGVIAADETPSTSDQALVLSKVDLVHESLLGRGIAKWAVTAIPNAVAEEYVKLVASESASSFGKVVDPAIIQLLEGRIRAVAIVMTGDTTFMTGHLVSVHEYLVNLGIALWDVNAIPQAFYEEYTKLVVAFASTSFGKETDPAIIAMLEDRVRKGAMVLNNDQAFMLGLVSDVHGSLIAQGIAGWAIAAIPRAFAEEYIKLTAGYAAASFGKPIDPAVVALLEDRVRRGATVMNNGQPFMLEQVSFVHASLQGQGIASWGLNAIPRSVAEDYIKLTTAYSALSFGKQVDPAVIAMLEDHVRKSAIVLTVNRAFMLDKVASVHAALDAQGVVWWVPGSVPRAFAEEYVKLTASMAASMFGKPVDPQMIALLEARIRKGAMVLSSDDNAQQAVQAVHDDLVMRGIARWTVFDIPDPVGPHYAVLAADRLAPLFGADTDPKDTALAMISIYRFIALPTSGETTPAAYF